MNVRCQSLGRVVTYSLFSIPTTITSYVILEKNTEWETLTVSIFIPNSCITNDATNNSSLQFLSFATYYCAVALGFTVFAWCFQVFRRRRKPGWHPENPGIASSSWGFKQHFQSSQNDSRPSQNASSLGNAFSTVSLFFQRSSPKLAVDGEPIESTPLVSRSNEE